MTTEQKIQYIANHYGYEPQSRQLIEEMAELTVAINKGWRKNHPVQVLQPTELGRGGDADGTKVYSKQFKNGVSKIYGRKIMFVRFVHTVHFQNAIVYAERSE